MILVVDIGNTNITCGLYEGDEMAESFRMMTQAQRTSDEYGVFIRDVLISNGYQPSDVEDVVTARLCRM